MHLASLGGTLAAAIGAFGGIRDHEGALTLTPRLPDALSRIAFGFRFKNRQIKVEVDHREARYEMVEGDPLELTHHGSPVTIATDAPVALPIPPVPVREPPKQPRGRAPARRRPGVSNTPL